MSKTVLLMRHGKSDWSVEDQKDFDRPLARRGTRAARLMGRTLSALGSVPDHVISSPAARACGTAELAGLAGGWPCAIELDATLYESDVDGAMRVMQRVPDTVSCTMLVGHEPTWSLLAGALIGGGSMRFPTAAVCRIDLRMSRWRDLDAGAGELRWLLLPRLLERLGLE